MALNSLGPFTFLDMSAPPPLVTEHGVVRVRPGANGILAQRIGLWGEPFETITRAGAQTLFLAEVEYDQYRSILWDPQELTWGGIAFLALGHVFIPRAVTPLRIRPIVRGIAPDGTAYFAETVVRWELQPMTVGNN